MTDLHHIVQVPLAPLREGPSDRAEQVSQLHAGEFCRIIGQGEKDWVEVELEADGYRGWCDVKQLLKVDGFRVESSSLIQSPISVWLEEDGSSLILPAGSRVQSNTSGNWFLAGRPLTPATDLDVCFHPFSSPLEAALNFMGSPYAWGGKSVLGMDCSGLTQMAYLLCGRRLPRDASQQVLEGEHVEWNHRQVGDLAFFSNENGTITHVGILASPNEIIHASGCVRRDVLTSEGILRDNRLTHAMSELRRV